MTIASYSRKETRVMSTANSPGMVSLLPPIPPPVARRPSAEINVPKAQTATKNCEWCKSAIPIEAIRCPKCQEWESDIIKHRRNVISQGIGLIIIFLATTFLCFAIWPKTRGGDMFSGFPGTKYHPWHEKVPDNTPADFGNSVMGKMLSNIANTGPNSGKYYWQFSLKNFLTSFSGWLVIICAVSFVHTLCSFSHSQSVLKQKTGSYYNF